MYLNNYATAGDFLNRAQVWLEQNEALNNLMLGVALRVRDVAAYGQHPPYFAAVQEGERLVAAAIMTPPYNLIVASDQPDCAAAFRLVAGDLHASHWPLPGVNGPTTLSRTFAEVWATISGQRYAIRMHQRIFELRTVIAPHSPPGAMRMAQEEDLELLAHWVYAFVREAGTTPQESLEETRLGVAGALQRGAYFVWDDQGLVSLAGRNRPTRRGISIGPVYTPPECRKRGYASALVAALSQQLLDEGKAFVTLFTDLANPTSNHIYQQVGFRPLADFDEYHFVTD
jgi:predicted GNAT family acetyltransferase